MFIHSAWAQEPVAPSALSTITAAATSAGGGTVSTGGGADVLLWNVGFVVLMIGMFYLLLIRPQQSRYREHADMVKALKKGDKVVLQSGMIATIDHAGDGDEMTVDLGHGQKVQIFRSAIAGKYDDIAKKK